MNKTKNNQWKINYYHRQNKLSEKKTPRPLRRRFRTRIQGERSGAIHTKKYIEFIGTEAQPIYLNINHQP